MSKYNNRKITVDGIKFDSIREANRYSCLKILQRQGVIHSLEMQKSFDLIDTVRTDIETLRKTVYKCDFYYYDDNRKEWIVEDVKGCITDVYALKKKLFLDRYDLTLFENGAKQKYYKKK